MIIPIPGTIKFGHESKIVTKVRRPKLANHDGRSREILSSEAEKYFLELWFAYSRNREREIYKPTDS